MMPIQTVKVGDGRLCERWSLQEIALMKIWIS